MMSGLEWTQNLNEVMHNNSFAVRYTVFNITSDLSVKYHVYIKIQSSLFIIDRTFLIKKINPA